MEELVDEKTSSRWTDPSDLVKNNNEKNNGLTPSEWDVFIKKNNSETLTKLCLHKIANQCFNPKKTILNVIIKSKNNDYLKAWIRFYRTHKKKVLLKAKMGK